MLEERLRSRGRRQTKYALASDLEDIARRGASQDAKKIAHSACPSSRPHRASQTWARRRRARWQRRGASLARPGRLWVRASGLFLGGVVGSNMGARVASMVRRYGSQEMSRIAREATTDGLLRATVNRVDDRLSVCPKVLLARRRGDGHRYEDAEEASARRRCRRG